MNSYSTDKFYSNELDLTFDDVLINPIVSTIRSRFSKDVNPYIFGKLPLVSSPMDTICCEKFIDAAKDKLFVIFSHRFQSTENQLAQIRYGASGAVIGLQTPIEEINEYVVAGAKHVLLDVANGANIEVLEKLKTLQHFRRIGVYLWAGNVANAESYLYIAPWCDYVRCNIGSGSACQTKIATNCGRGALSTILECASVYRSGLAQIVADGGIKQNGHITVALAAGAHLVMMGGNFAACDESAAEKVLNEHGKFKKFRGMASRDVNVEAGKTKFSVEGASGLVKSNGLVSEYLEQIEANLRSAMSYVDAHNLEELKTNSKFVRVSNSTKAENGSSLV